MTISGEITAHYRGSHHIYGKLAGIGRRSVVPRKLADDGRQRNLGESKYSYVHARIHAVVQDRQDLRNGLRPNPTGRTARFNRRP